MREDLRDFKKGDWAFSLFMGSLFILLYSSLVIIFFIYQIFPFLLGLFLRCFFWVLSTIHGIVLREAIPFVFIFLLGHMGILKKNGSKHSLVCMVCGRQQLQGVEGKNNTIVTIAQECDNFVTRSNYRHYNYLFFSLLGCAF